MVFKNVLTIDPGINTGVAYFTNSKLTPKTFQFSAGKGTDEQRISNLVCELQRVILRCKKINMVYIEGVAVWRNSVTSMTSATRGNLSFLAYIVGAYYATVISMGAPAQIINPNWKGQLTYEALEEWVVRATGHVYQSEHVLAAVSLGFKLAGVI